VYGTVIGSLIVFDFLQKRIVAKMRFVFVWLLLRSSVEILIVERLVT
jgi:hypothetical protein